MKKINKLFSIQSKITVSFSILILVTIITFIILSFLFSFNALKDNSLQYTYQLVKQVNNDIDSYISYMKDISTIVQTNNDVEAYLKEDRYEIETKNYLTKNIYQQLNIITLARSDIYNLSIFGLDNRYIFNKENVELNKSVKLLDQEWYTQAIAKKGEAYITSSHIQNIIDNNYPYVVSLSRAVIDKETLKPLGVVLVDLNYNNISNLCKNITFGKKGYIFIIDRNGEIIYHPQQQLIYSNLKQENIKEILPIKDGTLDGKDGKIYTINESKLTGWKIVGVTYIDELLINTPTINSYYLTIGLLFLIFSISISYFIAHRLSKPIKALEKSMKEVEKGNFNNKVEITSRDEIGQLANNYNIMTYKIKELVEQNTRNLDQKRKSELKILQAQIKPHFLYNTLDTIIWLAEMDESEDVISTTSALAKLFRISTKNQSEIIKINEEIEYVNSYITIQKARYRKKIDFMIDIQENILDMSILKFLLQPLVENAIYHGLKNKIGGGKVTILGYLKENNIIFEIIDTGMGMTQEELKLIVSGDRINKNHGNGLGVKNVNERINLYYGENKGYGLKYESNYGEGTRAIIIIPSSYNGGDSY